MVNYEKTPTVAAACPQLYKCRDEKSELFTLGDYRCVYAVISQDTLYVHDTFQRMPLASFTNLHFGTLTDISWYSCIAYFRSSNGQMLILSSSDGYCSLIVFDNGDLGDLAEKVIEPIVEPLNIENIVHAAGNNVKNIKKPENKTNRKRITPTLLS